MKSTIAKYALLFLILFATFAESFGQLKEAIEEEGDIKFQNNLFLEAANFYKKALELDPNFIRVQYKLGDTYRKMRDYESAESYYQPIAESENSVFPLAGFYYALMQKQKGKYSEAMKTFKKFDDFMVKLNLHEDDEYRYFYKQAKVEIDGSQLAVNQITLVQPDHNFEVLAPPLNSEFSDYAAFSVGADTELCLTSARKGGKGSLVDSQFGEGLTDLFRFVDNGAGWKTHSPADRFESIINTKEGEGSGSFNVDRTKFYYTNCGDNLDGVCHIYVSVKNKGKWTQAVPLNNNINVSGFRSQHPNLSLGGDTLFYVTDREGGFGELDIWMSINAGSDNWGPPVNLGEQINTPFNELSPFYDKKDKALFFSSNGHRGFGGFDIYIARGSNFSAVEIYNAGMPFNSNSDDMFFFLGNERGYLSSSREGGLGNFDIYGFNIKSKQDLISEVSSEETIAGRNSLFTEDYNFDSRKPEIVNQIISRTLASSFSEVEMVLTDDQLEVYNSLSQDDRDRIDKIVKARLRKMTNSMLRSVRSEDDFYYQDLDTDRRRQVDGVVTSHLEQRGIGHSVTLSEESSEFYNSVDPKEREKLDILLTERTRNANEYSLITSNYSAFNEKDREMLDALTTIYFEQKKGWQSAVLRVNQRDFWKTNFDEKEFQVKAAVRERLLTLGQDEEYKMNEADREFYSELSEPFKRSLRSLASTYLLSDFDSFEEILNEDDLEVYGEFGSAKKKTLDRLLLKVMANLANADLYKAETSFSKEVLSASRRRDPDDTYAALVQTNPDMTEEDKTALKRFIRSSYETYLMQDEPIYLTVLPVLEIVATRDNYVDPLSNAAEPVYDLNPLVLDDYTALSAPKKQVIDKLVGLKYINKSYDEGDLESADTRIFRSMDDYEKKHIEILSKGVRSDELNEVEKSWLLEAFTFYNVQSKARKALLNRLVLSRVFNGVNGNYILTPQDAKVNGVLTLEDRELLDEIKKFRFSNERILTENMTVEAKDVDEVPVSTIALVRPSKSSPDKVVDLPDTKSEEVVDTREVLTQQEELNVDRGEVILDIPTQDIGTFTDLVISGQLVGGPNSTPLKSYPLGLRQHDKEKTVIDEFTDAQGFFSFYVPVNDYHFLTESINGVTNLKIKNLKVEGRLETSESLSASRAYFDLGSFKLRNETTEMLDELVEFYKKKKFRIEIESHTDNTGNAKLNLALSKSRGNSALDYLESKGVAKSDVSVIWHGQGKPVASNNNPFGRQLNRRLDIRMISNGKLIVDFGEIYLVRPGATLQQIASSFKLTLEQLKNQNGMTSIDLRSYQPIRIKGTTSSPNFNLVAPSTLSNISDFVYKVQPGESIHDIAGKFNVPEELIIELNGLTPPNVPVGKELKIYPSSSD